MPRNRSSIIARTRGNTATLKIECEHSTTRNEHTISINLDGNIQSQHDVEADQVLMALGGEIHSCGKAVNSFYAAQMLYRIMIGETDLPTIRYNNNKGWYDKNTCDTCPNISFNLTHQYSLNHLSQTFNADKNTLRTLYKWILRNSTNSKTIDTQTSKKILKNMNEEIFFPTINGLYLSENYITSAEKIIGGNPKSIVETRLNGITVEWFKELANLVHTTAADYARKSNENLYASLTKARNVSPAQVAKYMNAGITTHFYTYSRVNAQVEDILTIYRTTKGRTTLAELLNNGYTIPQALREYGRNA